MEQPTRSRIIACIGDTLESLAVLDGAAVEESLGLLGRGVGLDSIEALRIVTDLEERFGITIEDDALDPVHFKTVGTLAGFIEEQIG